MAGRRTVGGVSACSEQGFDGDGQFTDAAAGGVEDRVDDGRSHADVDDLAEAFDADGVGFQVLVAVEVDPP
jgi:hypothetical protein